MEAVTVHDAKLKSLLTEEKFVESCSEALVNLTEGKGEAICLDGIAPPANEAAEGNLVRSQAAKLFREASVKTK